MRERFNHFARWCSRAAGSPWAFGVAVVVIVSWLVTGPFCRFSDTWQLVINTGTTIVTFLMVFLIQSTQNRGDAALQAKLDALIEQSDTSNRYIGLEDVTEQEMEALRTHLKEIRKQ